MGVKFKNNASTTLSSAVNNSVTTIPVVSGAVFPTLAAGDHTYITLATSDNSKVEVMKCTAINSNDLTVVRGQDGTSAQAFDSGDKAEGRLTVAGLNDAGGAFNDFVIKTSAYTAVAKDQIIVNSSSAVTITLPASPSAGDVVFIKATGGGTVTVGRNSSKINSTADDGEISSGSAASLVFCDATIGWLEL
tara:strand:+ start:244 stop:816 length:573 start_codon:yes stop_codon:yes gene_type:complete